MDCSTPGFPFLHHLLELAQTHVHWVSDAIQPSHPVIPFSSCLKSFPASGFYLMSWLFASSGQSIGASASESVLPMNIKGWFLLGLTGLISLQSKGPSRVSSNTTVRNHQFLPKNWGIRDVGSTPELKRSRHSGFFIAQLSHPHLTTGKNTALTYGPLSAQSCLCFLTHCLGFRN